MSLKSKLGVALLVAATAVPPSVYGAGTSCVFDDAGEDNSTTFSCVTSNEKEGGGTGIGESGNENSTSRPPLGSTPEERQQMVAKGYPPPKQDAPN